MDDQELLKHFDWLATERRHIHKYRDRSQIERGLKMGWISTQPGIMEDDGYVRVRITEAGARLIAAVRQPGSAGR